MTGECDGASGPLGKLCKSAGGGGGGGERDLIGSDFSFIHEQGRGPGRKSANNEEKSPTNIYIYFFSFLIPGSTWFFGGENLNCPLKWTEQRPGLGGGSRMGGGNFVQVSSFDKCVRPRSAQPAGRPRPPQRPGCMGMSAFGWWLLDSLLFSGLPRVRVR